MAGETGTPRPKLAGMALDQSKVGQHIAKQMEAIEADYGEDCEIGDVCTIVEVRGPHGSHVRMRKHRIGPALDPRPPEAR